MVTTLPRLRRDLTKSRQEAGGSTSLVVKDPETSRFYRFRDAAGYIADRLDGETPLEEVRRAAETRFGGALPPGTLRAFIRNLDASGLLEHGDAAKPAKPRRQGRIRGGPLYLRLALFDPDALFTRLERRVRFLFTPSFVVLSAAIIFMAAWVTITECPAITGTLARVYRPSAIPLILAVSCAIVSFHEAAHGLTCKHFGGEVHETGFMLIYFQPAFYANVSDAWLFPERSKRLWVGFAGPWFELFLWALATLLWRGSDLDSGISRMAYIAMTVSGVKTLFNFNPFIKLDGYYLLSDALDMPNLRRRSFRYVGGLIQRLLGLDPGVRDEGTRRDRIPGPQGSAALPQDVRRQGGAGRPRRRRQHPRRAGGRRLGRSADGGCSGNGGPPAATEAPAEAAPAGGPAPLLGGRRRGRGRLRGARQRRAPDRRLLQHSSGAERRRASGDRRHHRGDPGEGGRYGEGGPGHRPPGGRGHAGRAPADRGGHPGRPGQSQDARGRPHGRLGQTGAGRGRESRGQAALRSGPAGAARDPCRAAPHPAGGVRRRQAGGVALAARARAGAGRAQDPHQRHPPRRNRGGAREARWLGEPARAAAAAAP